MGIGRENLKLDLDRLPLDGEGLAGGPRIAALAATLAVALEELLGVEGGTLVEPWRPQPTTGLPGGPHQHLLAPTGPGDDRRQRDGDAPLERLRERAAQLGRERWPLPALS